MYALIDYMLGKYYCKYNTCSWLKAKENDLLAWRTILPFLFFVVLNCSQNVDALKPCRPKVLAVILYAHAKYIQHADIHSQIAEKKKSKNTFPDSMGRIVSLSAARHKNPGASVLSVRGWQWRGGCWRMGTKHTTVCPSILSSVLSADW